jgi:hypothetical protein
MATHTSLPNEKLSPWYFATRYAAMVLEARIALADEKEWLCEYDKRQLEVLLELEEYLDSTWKAWMDLQEQGLKQSYAILNGAKQ